MTTFVSGGHWLKDSGAVSKDKKLTEFKEMAGFRDTIVKYLKSNHPEIKVITDRDEESLAEYLKRIQTGNGSVVCEFHLDAWTSDDANGATVITKNNPDKNTLNCANEVLDAIHEITGIRKRGVIGEAKSNRGKLGLMREEGIVILVELGFITNSYDMEKLKRHWEKLAEKLAAILAKYDNLI